MTFPPSRPCEPEPAFGELETELLRGMETTWGAAMLGDNRTACDAVTLAGILMVLVGVTLCVAVVLGNTRVVLEAGMTRGG
jgi:hypothetical protein